MILGVEMHRFLDRSPLLNAHHLSIDRWGSERTVRQVLQSSELASNFARCSLECKVDRDVRVSTSVASQTTGERGDSRPFLSAS